VALAEAQATIDSMAETFAQAAQEPVPAASASKTTRKTPAKSQRARAAQNAG
jgi:hypothetical protein